MSAVPGKPPFGSPAYRAEYDKPAGRPPVGMPAPAGGSSLDAAISALHAAINEADPAAKQQLDQALQIVMQVKGNAAAPEAAETQGP